MESRFWNSYRLRQWMPLANCSPNGHDEGSKSFLCYFHDSSAAVSDSPFGGLRLVRKVIQAHDTGSKRVLRTELASGVLYRNHLARDVNSLAWMADPPVSSS